MPVSCLLSGFALISGFSVKGSKGRVSPMPPRARGPQRTRFGGADCAAPPRVADLLGLAWTAPSVGPCMGVERGGPGAALGLGLESLAWRDSLTTFGNAQPSWGWVGARETCSLWSLFAFLALGGSPPSR